MAEGTSNSNNNSLSNLSEFREMVDIALNVDVSSHTENNHDQTIDQALLSLNTSNDSQPSSSMNTTTAVSVAELPTDITDSFNVAAKQLSFLYESVINTGTSEHGEELVEISSEIVNGIAEPYSDEETDQFPSFPTVPNTTSSITTNDHQQPKRHIMISYNRSSRVTCQKIYDCLIEKDYKVWMDLTDMADDILVSMARAVENSYIVLMCINQQYYESEYCRLEAEYAAENRIKFIPCLMEKSFRAQSWLGIIKGSNVHIDFSTPEDFDQSFEELIRQISYVERKLALQPRRTPGPSSMTNPMRNLSTMTSAHRGPSTLAEGVNSRRFDAIIREYKHSIKKKPRNLNKLKRNELSELIVKLRQELFTETSQVLNTDGERSDEDDDKQNTDDQFLQQLLTRSLDQNELLLRLMDRLTTPQDIQPNPPRPLDMDGIIKVILAIMLLWTLHILCQKESR